MSDLDPAEATSQADLVACLHQLYVGADSPSYRELKQRTGRRSGELPGTGLERVRLGRSSIRKMLRGAAFPKQAFMLTFVEACGVDVTADRRWAEAWDRLSKRYAKRARQAPWTELAQLRQEVAHLRGELIAVTQDAEKAQADLQAASTRIVQASALERRRIQQDLHDGIQGRLAALGPRLGAVKATTTDQRAAAQIADIRDALAQVLTDLRKLVAGIRPDVLNLGLKAAVTNICRPYQSDLTITIDLPDVPLPEQVEYTAFLAISEAITNVAKHACARSADISGQLQDGVLTVSVTDDGVGGVRSNYDGTGLVSITDRITALKGHVQITSPPGQGTRVTMKIPYV